LQHTTGLTTVIFSCQDINIAEIFITEYLSTCVNFKTPRDWPTPMGGKIQLPAALCCILNIFATPFRLWANIGRLFRQMCVKLRKTKTLPGSIGIGSSCCNFSRLGQVTFCGFFAPRSHVYSFSKQRSYVRQKARKLAKINKYQNKNKPNLCSNIWPNRPKTKQAETEQEKTFRWLTLRTTSSCCPTSRQVNWPIAVFILFSGQQQKGLFAAKVN